MVDLLIKNKAAEESERESLMALSEKNLTLMTNAFPPKKTDPEEEVDPKTGKPMKPPVAAQVDMNALADLVVAKLGQQAPVLNAEDRAALDAAKAVISANRAALVSRITANSKMTADSLKTMDDAALQVIADGLQPAVNFGGRGAPVANEVGSDETELKVMSGVTSLSDMIKSKRSNGGAA
jgi:hypothetical protein